MANRDGPLSQQSRTARRVAYREGRRIGCILCLNQGTEHRAYKIGVANACVGPFTTVGTSFTTAGWMHSCGEEQTGQCSEVEREL